MNWKSVVKIGLALCIILLVSILSCACAGPEPQYEPAECQFPVPQEYDIECGYLTVPENRAQKGSNSRTVRLHVAKVKSWSENPLPDPLVYLHGGPGSILLERTTDVVVVFDYVLSERDLILFDQRGVGYSEPSLDCPEVTDLFYADLAEQFNAEEEKARTLAAYRACRDRLVAAGIDLTAYTSAASAADLNDLRLALGYEEWNLYGISYGTRLALTAMRDFPKGIRSVILDSVVPLQIDNFASFGACNQHALDVLFQNCAAYPYCSRYYPDLEQVLNNLIAQLDAEPIMVRVYDRQQEQSYDILVDGNAFTSLIVELLHITEAIPMLPKLIYDTHQGEYQDLAGALGETFSSEIGGSEGTSLSVVCNEEIPFTSPQIMEAAYADIDPILQKLVYNDVLTILDMCDFWPTRMPDAIENQPVTSDIPALVLSGEYDPVTPPSFGRTAVETLTNATHFEFPSVGHGVVYEPRGCANTLMIAFLDDPTSVLDGSCVEQGMTLFH
jgi:pimeloyl-ACP methyl ester carboxylesterase